MSIKTNFQQLAQNIKQWAHELGFQHVGITDTNLSNYKNHFQEWLKNNFHGEMSFMQDNQEKRLHPEKLIPKTLRVISVSMNYYSHNKNLHISQHAKGKDYHKLIRKRLQKLADKIIEATGPIVYRAFTDSAPVLEKALAEKAGLGWIGKNTTLINKKFGSWCFLGELFINLPLPIDTPSKNNCGDCQKCLDACPTRALIAPYQLDARKCISYLTIEHKGPIPNELQPLIGKQIFGCDVCQKVCPWNQKPIETNEEAFKLLQAFDQATLSDMLSWTEKEFLEKTKGSDIRKLGYEKWQKSVSDIFCSMNYDTD